MTGINYYDLIYMERNLDSKIIRALIQGTFNVFKNLLYRTIRKHNKELSDNFCSQLGYQSLCDIIEPLLEKLCETLSIIDKDE